MHASVLHLCAGVSIPSLTEASECQQGGIALGLYMNVILYITMLFTRQASAFTALARAVASSQANDSRLDDVPV